MNATGKRRLLKLADFLYSLPRRTKFNMDFFAEKIDDGKPACGTAACAAGWAASIPSFRRAGYKLIRQRHGGFSGGIGAIVPAFRKARGDDALNDFFDLEHYQTIQLFGSGNPNDPKDAARRIREIVREAA